MSKKIFLIVLLLLAGQMAAAQQDTPTAEPQHEFPYKAQVVGTDVYVRSGPAIQYYYTTQVSQPEVVTVVGNVYSWYKIVPPKGSFSWVTKDEVMIDTENPGTGIITGDNVRIWAGRTGIAPEDSTSLQVKLNKGDKVKLLGEESGDYYKIAPPEGAYLWIKGEYLKFLSSIETDEPAAAPQTEKPVEKAVDVNEPKEVQQPAEPNEAAPAVITREPEKPAKSPYEIKQTKKVYDLIKNIDQEVNQPLEKQNYDNYKNQLQSIVNDPNAGTASKYAKYQLERIRGYELAKMAEKELSSQDKKLQELRNKIAARRAEMLKKLKKGQDYLITGQLKKSLVFADAAGSQRYLIVNDDGKIISYAVAVDDASYMDLSGYVGKKVGLYGEAVPDTASGISLVKFDAIEVIEE